MKRGKIKTDSNQFIDIFSRYFLLILLSLNGLWVFYFVFTPPTIYPIYLFLEIFFDVSLLGKIILINNTLPIEFIPACIAGSAHYLLLILNLSIPNIDLKKRLKMVLFAFGSLLAINIIRIVLLILVFLYGNSFFDITHEAFWYLISTIFVIGIWFLEVKIFEIKQIPIYSDLKFLYNKTRLEKKTNKTKRRKKN